MTYCPECGKQNENDATYCNKCGTSLSGTRKEYEKDRAEECFGGPRYAPIVWGSILVLIGLVIIIQGVFKNIEGLPAWVYQIDFGWVFALIIGLLLIILGIRKLLMRD
jgi:uncharacterized membrane protein YvbJ